ncbi:MAG: LapA family protein [Phycisphaerales bacterium JB040]
MQNAKKIKLIAAAVAVVLVVIVIFQNTASVETRILFLTVSMPRALLLFVAVAVGFAGGLVAAMSVLKKKGEKGGESGGAGDTGE